MLNRTQTIAAIASGKGEAAIGIVRISGTEARQVIDTVVPKARASSKPRRVLAGRAISPLSGKTVDDVLCFYCPGPGTATGEDIAELHGHGGQLSMRRLLQAALDAGASPAEPGEFTYRAYRNGRLDLTQAEAVMSLIGARSDRAQQLSLRHLEGGLGLDLDDELKGIIDVAARLEARLDFPDDDLPVDESELLTQKLKQLHGRLRSLANSYQLGERIVTGAQVAIIGPPNAGKSSLLNALVRDDRALVDNEPGTTRDVVEARGEADGIPLTFLDTAGIRSGAGRVESRGIEKSKQTVEKADLVLVVWDGAGDNQADAQPIARMLAACATTVLLVLNKSDREDFSSAVPDELGSLSSVTVSAQSQMGIDQLRERIGQTLFTEHEDEGHILTTARQQRAVGTCNEYLERALGILSSGQDIELAADDLRWARSELAALWGRDAEEEVIDAIFSTFCLGK